MFFRSCVSSLVSMTVDPTTLACRALCSGPIIFRHPVPPFPRRSLLNETFVEYAVRASLIDSVDKRVLVQLRDSKQFIGDLRSFDQVLWSMPTGRWEVTALATPLSLWLVVPHRLVFLAVVFSMTSSSMIALLSDQSMSPLAHLMHPPHSLPPFLPRSSPTLC